MKIIVGNRGMGKTFRMIQWFVEDPNHRAIIVPNAVQRQLLVKDIIKAFPEMGERTRAWISHIGVPALMPHEFSGHVIKEAWIDNVDQVIRNMVGYSIPVTMTSSEKIEVEHI